MLKIYKAYKLLVTLTDLTNTTFVLVALCIMIFSEEPFKCTFCYNLCSPETWKKRNFWRAPVNFEKAFASLYSEKAHETIKNYSVNSERELKKNQLTLALVKLQT